MGFDMRDRRIAREGYDTDDLPSPFIEELLAFVHYRELIFQLISRSVKTRYKRSFLGVAWTMVNPLLTMGVLTLVFSRSLWRTYVRRKVAWRGRDIPTGRST